MLRDPGKYSGRITNAALSESETSKTPQVEVAVDLVSDEHGPITGYARVYLSLTDATIGTTNEPGWVILTLMAYGFRGPSFANLDALEGRPCELKMEHDAYKGETKEKWSLFRPYSGPKNPASKATISGLDQKFAALLNVAKKTPALPKAAAPIANGAATGKNGAAPAPAKQYDGDPEPTREELERNRREEAAKMGSPQQSGGQEEEIPF